jgi:hypothetical protein
MGFLKNYLDKIACHHEWQVHFESRVYEYSFSQRPYKIEQTLICKKCGKIKKIQL